MYGNLKQIEWLFKVYKENIIRKVFLEKPQNIYTPPAFYFIKNIILGLKNTFLSKKKYVKTLF